MKKSEFKEYLKTEILKMNEADQEDIKAQQDLNKELESTKGLKDELGDALSEGKVKKSEFKEYLRNEILREIAEAEGDEEETEETETEETETDAEGGEEITTDTEETETEETASPSDDLSGLSDELVDLAKKAKDAGAVELANQILNSAKFANKTKIKSVEKEAGLKPEA